MSNAPKKSIPRPGRNTESVKTEAATPSTSRHIALLAAQAGLEKKATNIEIIDVTGKVDYADYLVLMTGASDRNVSAIAQEVDGVLAKAGFRSMSVEGLPSAQWVLVDFVDVVVHVFQKDVRSLYDLDGLWMDAERVPLEPGATAPDADLVEAAPSEKSTRTVKATSKKRATKKAKTTTRTTTRTSRTTSAKGATSKARTSKGTTSRAAASKGSAAKAATPKAAAPKSATRKATAGKATRRAKVSRSK